ncbi:MAG: hypothetical protein FWD71_07125 [Oscillospiraceae bacterium]|nr:hypothetical protein [Oscillospiraceae bacterium]
MGIFVIIFLAILVIAVIYILREFWTWYFKINKIVSLLEDISRKLDKLDKIDTILNSNKNNSDIENGTNTENN